MRILLDGVLVRKPADLPPLIKRRVRSTQRRYWRAQRRRQHEPRAGGALAATLSGGFTQTLHIFTSGSGATETILAGGNNLEIQGWGAGGLPGTGAGSGCAARGGGGGGAGGYSRCTISIVGSGGKTLTYTVGTSGGSASSISSGTFTINTITCNGGSAGGTAVSGGANGGGGSGGTATNTNSGAVNTTGATGSAGTNSLGGAGASGTSGNVSGDGSPYGAGGHGGFGASQTGQTSAGTGAAVFFYT